MLTLYGSIAFIESSDSPVGSDISKGKSVSYKNEQTGCISCNRLTRVVELLKGAPLSRGSETLSEVKSQVESE